MEESAVAVVAFKVGFICPLKLALAQYKNAEMVNNNPIFNRFMMYSTDHADA